MRLTLPILLLCLTLSAQHRDDLPVATARGLLQDISTLRRSGAGQDVEHALLRLGTQGSSLLSELQKLCQDPREHVRRRGYQVLATARFDIRPAQATLMARLSLEKSAQLDLARALLRLEPTQARVIAILDGQGSFEDRRRLIEALCRNQSPAAIPLLRRALRTPGMEHSACRSLFAYKNPPPVLVPALIDLLEAIVPRPTLPLEPRRHPHIGRRNLILRVLHRIGNAGTPALIDAYPRAGAASRRTILEVLCRNSEPHPRLAAFCLQQLRQGADATRQRAAQLAAVVVRDKKLPPHQGLELARLSQSIDEHLGHEVRLELARCHPASVWPQTYQTASTALRQTILNLVPQVPIAARRQDQEVFDAMVQAALEDPQPTLRQAATRALLGHRFPFVETSLCRMLGDPEPACRITAATTLAAFDRPSVDSGRALGRALDDREPAVQAAALEAVTAHAPRLRHSRLLPQLAVLSSHPDPALSAAALVARIVILPPGAEQQRVLQRVVTIGRPATTELRSRLGKHLRLASGLLQTEDPASLEFLLRSLLAQHHHSRDTAARLAALCGHPRVAIREWATRLLSRRRQVQQEPAALGANLVHPSTALRRASATLLSRLPPQLARRQVNAVARLLGGRSMAQRYSAADCLRSLGADAGEVMPQILDALQTPDGLLARKLLEVLQQLGPRHRGQLRRAIPILQKLAKTGPRPARRPAQALLESLR